MPREEVRVGGEKNGRKRGRLGLRMGVCEWGSGSKEVKKKRKVGCVVICVVLT